MKKQRRASKTSIQDNLRMDEEEIARATLSILHMEEEIGLGDSTHIRMAKSGKKRRSGCHFRLSGIVYITCSQCAAGSISRRMLHWMLEQEVACLWECPECGDASRRLRSEET